MKRLGLTSVRRFLKDQNGLTVVEYVFAAALLVGAVALIFLSLEVGLTSKFNNSISSIGQD